ncbi:uncharacterized protein LOC124274214 [Haliotis rubra]|uniref:uncharacterized protein LOC124274214 n=1 Tax=Haliotis rubra TaxID=36100 RepID=UPI001EE573CF|nr:uncharacterized protein LOC124274214 [Haliotis rubra]
MLASAFSDVFSVAVDSPNMESIPSLVNVVLSKLPDATHDHKRELLNLFSDLKDSAMRDLKSRFKTYAEKCADFFQQGDFKKNADTFRTSVLCVERLMMHHFRERSKSFVVGSSFTDAKTDNSKKRRLSHNAHQVALKECESNIVKELNIERTTLMDELISVDLMTEDDRQSILAKPTPKAKSNDFFRLMHGKLTLEQTKNIFLPAVGKEHPWLAKHISMKMQELEHQEQITTCVCCRMRDIVEVKRIADYLREKGLVSVTQHADLTNSALANNTKWTEVLKCPHPDMQSVVISSLESTYPDLYNDFQFFSKNDFACFCEDIAEQTNINGTASDVDNLCVDVARMSDFMSISTPVQKTPATYKNRAGNRNLCVIICNNNYKHLTGTTNAELTLMHDTDIANIKDGFEKYNFQFETHKNVTAAQVVSLCQRLSSSDQLKQVNIIAIFVLSVFQSERLVGVDGASIPLENITAYFTATRCPHMAGKPKVFFIQTSRGTEHGKCMAVRHDVGDPLSPWSVIPDNADFFVGYPASSGLTSYGIPGKGSLYITSLMKVLDKHGSKHDFLTCMQMVNDAMSQMTLEFDDTITQQIACPVFSLRKRMYLCGDDTLSEASHEGYTSAG